MKLLLAVLVAALAILPSCGTSSEPTKEAVQLAFASDRASGSPAAPVTFTATASNLGLFPAWHYEGCGVGAGVRVDYYDAEGNLLHLNDPLGPQPACADVLFPLAPGKTLEVTSRFDGTLYSRNPDLADRRYPAPAGHYRARATFSYFRDPEQRHDEVVLTQSVDFDWAGPESTEPDIQLELSVNAEGSCRFIHHFVLSGRVLNTGGKPARYDEGCNAIRVRLFDPSGSEVIFEDPDKAAPCSDQVLSLDPGADVRTETAFGGNSYFAVPGGYEWKLAPEGLYTVRIEFRYLDAKSVERIATASATFTWSNAVTCGT